MAERATLAVRDAVRRALADVEPGELVLVACSGGADSLALAAATAFVAPRVGWRSGGVVIDHRLQPGSGEVAGWAAGVCRTLGLAPVAVRSVSVGSHGGPEAAARDARYEGLLREAQDLGAVAVLLGHTLEDQAETVLLRLARGSGARSLAAMAPRSGLWRRPMLELSRAVVHASAREALVSVGETPWIDPHNADARFARVRVRESMDTLARALGRSSEMDWMAVSSYGSGTKSSGVVRILKDLDCDLAGRNVLLVEDILDSGLTLSWLMTNLSSRGPASVEVFTLLRKPEAMKVQVTPKYVGFDIPNEFVVGYGLDYDQKYRNLRCVGTLAKHVYGG